MKHYMYETHISIVEDNPGIRESLSMFIEATEGFVLVRAYPNAELPIQNILQKTPDVVLMGINLPNSLGIVLKKNIVHRFKF